MVQPPRSPVLVGREQELGALEDALLRASRGEGGLVLLAGEAGQGKTRLATELAAQARKLDFGVLWGSCSEAELSLPYLPFMQAFGNYLTERGPVSVAAALGPAARELAQLFPQLAQGGREPEGGGEPDDREDPAQAKVRLFAEIVTP